ncbi:MAG: arginine--tRNA ligase [Candidatus Thorarchaeota archaeon]
MTESYLENPWRSIVDRVTDIVARVAGVQKDIVLRTVETPPDPSLGDLAYTIAFRLAKEQKKNPNLIATELASSVGESGDRLVRRAESKGPYLNVFLDPGTLASIVIPAVSRRGKEYGMTTVYRGESALIESPAVNPSKPWHIGHARNAIIGDTLGNILEAVGYRVVRTDYINDLGLQVAQLTWKMMNIPSSDVKEKYDHYLGRLYVEVQEAFEKDKKVEEEVREVARQLENLDSVEFGVSSKMVEECLRAQNQTSYRLGIYHDYQVWESTIAHSGLLDRAREMMLRCDCVTRLEEGEKKGCIVVMLDRLDEFKNMKEPYKVLFRSDGTRTYTGADLAFQMWKFGIVEDPFRYEVFEKQPNGRPVYRTTTRGRKRRLGKFDYVFNVIGSDQVHPQKLIYTILDLMGYKQQSQNSRHVVYEFVDLEGADLSGRLGTWVGYTCDDVLNRLEALALEEVNRRNPDQPEEVRVDIAKRVAVGALRYFMLKASPERRIVFRWNEALDFTGDAGPYLQYSVARARRIMEKAPSIGEEPDLSLLSSQHEFALVKMISRLPEEIIQIVDSIRQNVWDVVFNSNRLTTYCYELATLFSRFYDACPVLRTEPAMMAARIRLVKAYEITMSSAMRLLGIPVVDRM